MKAAALGLVVIASSGACGDCCFEPPPRTTVSITFVSIEPPAGTVDENPVAIDLYVMWLTGCEAEFTPPVATAWVNGVGPVALTITSEPNFAEGCVMRTPLNITGDVPLTPGTNEVRINVFAQVGYDEPDVDEDYLVTYEIAE